MYAFHGNEWTPSSLQLVFCQHTIEIPWIGETLYKFKLDLKALLVIDGLLWIHNKLKEQRDKVCCVIFQSAGVSTVRNWEAGIFLAGQRQGIKYIYEKSYHNAEERRYSQKEHQGTHVSHDRCFLTNL